MAATLNPQPSPASDPRSAETVLRPQAGPQEQFLSSSADIVIYGGAAGGGKTWGLLLEVIRHHRNPRFRAVIFRRTYAQVANPGGLWDESVGIFAKVGAEQRGGDMRWRFRSGAELKFGHLQHEGDEYNWQGAQIAYIGFDELTHFSEAQFFYLLSRNRTMSGIRPYVRATCNPDADSWVAPFISWWIGEDGYPIRERAGVVRWFVRVAGVIHWADAPHELVERFGAELLPKSVTFIPARLSDNQALMEADPGYLANLQAQTLIEQERLLKGNWKIRAEAGKVFHRDWFEITDFDPRDGIAVRFFDLAASEKKQAGDDPDFSASILLLKSGRLYYVLDAKAERLPPARVDEWMMQLAAGDRERFRSTPVRYMLRWEQEPGGAGARENYRMVTIFDGYDCAGVLPDGDKLTRAMPLAAQAYAGNVKFQRGAWNESLLVHLHHQPDTDHDDLMDAASGAYNVLAAAGEGDAELLAAAFGYRSPLPGW